ncbi:DUF502 domain-containing protein [Candidatus Igneacidithiobacillus taiwanensis]|uniref:DUF502 domain-containing protein n=1 Tax=Candidatus Igneacidithiobacillus taiwanensis TaxID=1945924 RepID=UPI002898E3C7|nr:DUF502 domain-containing protein [Candidatus Igneacidithiobacillus taiwanensis]MCE5360637.1 DUF502 domain-containing protein [Acidithiobacillus sp.]
MLPLPNPKMTLQRRWHPRRWFIQGLLISLPIGLTIYVVLVVGGWVDSIFAAPIHAIFGMDIPGLGIILTLLCIFAVGFLASHVFTAWIFERLNALLERIPVLHSLYSTIQETVELLFGGKERGFRSAVLLRQEGDMGYLVGLVTRDQLPELSSIADEDCIAVFVPMSYGVGGFTCVVPRSRVIPLPEMSPQQALRFAMAGGVGSGRTARERVLPEQQPQEVD